MSSSSWSAGRARHQQGQSWSICWKQSPSSSAGSIIALRMTMDDAKDKDDLVSDNDDNVNEDNIDENRMFTGKMISQWKVSTR